MKDVIYGFPIRADAAEQRPPCGAERFAAEEQTGFAIPEKYRQHTNRGVVVEIGDGIQIGGEWSPMGDFVNVGDIVKYGEYTAERYGPDDEDLFIIRLQDVRTVERVRE